MKRILLLGVFLFLFSCISHAVGITGCQALSAGTSYTLTADITNTATNPCYTTAGASVTLNLNGHTVDGIGTNDFYSDAGGDDTFTVFGGRVQDFDQAIVVSGSTTSWYWHDMVFDDISGTSAFDFSANSAGRFDFINISNSGAWQFRAISASNNLTDSTFTNCTGDCFQIDGNSDNNQLIRVNMTGAVDDGVQLTGALQDGTNLTTVRILGAADDGIRMEGDDAIFTNVTIQGASECISTTNGAVVFNNIGLFNCTSNYISSTPSYTINNITLGYSEDYGNANFTVSYTSDAEITEGTNVRGLDPFFFSLDGSALADLNITATVKLFSPDCAQTAVYLDTGFPSSQYEIYTEGSAYATASCADDAATFSATGFWGYALGYIVRLVNSTNYPLPSGTTNISTILYVTFFDESTGLPISIDNAVLSFNVWNSTLDDTVARNYSVSYAASNATANATVNAHPDWATANISSIESYAKADYAPRSRFMIFAETPLDQQQNVSVYLIPLSDASYGIITVVDRGSPVQGAYVEILKYFSTTSAYTLIDEKVTNNEGQAATYIDPIAYYKFLILDSEGNTIYLSADPEQFICDPTCKIVISIGDQVPTHWITPYATASCYGNASANSIIYSYSDPTGFTSTINWLAWRGDNLTPVVNVSVSASAAGYVANLSAPENLSAYVYTCAIQRTASPPWTVFADILDLRDAIAFMEDFPFVALMIVIAPAAMGILIHPAFGVVGALMGLFGTQILGMTNLPETAMIGFVVVGAVLVFLFVRDDSG